MFLRRQAASQQTSARSVPTRPLLENSRVADTPKRFAFTAPISPPAFRATQARPFASAAPSTQPKALSKKALATAKASERLKSKISAIRARPRAASSDAPRRDFETPKPRPAPIVQTSSSDKGGVAVDSDQATKQRTRALEQGASKAPNTVRNEIAKFYGESRDLILASEWAEHLLQSDLAGAEVWNNFLDYWSAENDIEAVHHTFTLMKAQEVPPNVRTFNIIYRMFTQLAQSPRVLTFCEQMMSLKVKPNALTASLLLLLEQKAKGTPHFTQLQRAIKEIVLEATEGDPNSIDPILLIKEFARGGVVGGVNDVLEQMKKDGISTKTTFVVNHLIMAYGRAKNFAKAVELYNQTKKANTDTPPDTETLNRVLDACRINEKYTEAMKYLAEMTNPKSDWRVSPNLKTEIMLLKIYGEEAQIQPAFAAAERIISEVEAGKSKLTLTYKYLRTFTIAVVIHNGLAPFNQLEVVTFAGKSLKLQHQPVSREDLAYFKASLDKWNAAYNAMNPKPTRKSKQSIAEFLALDTEVDRALAMDEPEDLTQTIKHEQPLFNDTLMKPLPPPPKPQ